VTRSIEELDYSKSRLGDLVLRRRRVPSLNHAEVYEVTINGEFLMSSLVNASEVALADLGLAGCAGGALDVVVGGLGLGHTARAALDDPRVKELVVVEYLPEVIAWHRKGLVPLGEGLCADARCRIVEGDFFAPFHGDAPGFDPDAPDRRFDAVLVDIDHSPESLLHPRHGGFYGAEGLARLQIFLKPGGVFALWSADPPDDAFTQTLGAAFGEARAEGTRGTLHLTGDGALRLRPFGTQKGDVILAPRPWLGFAGDCVYAFQAHVIAHLAEGAPLETEVSSYLPVLDTEAAIYESAKVRTRVAL